MNRIKKIQIVKKAPDCSRRKYLLYYKLKSYRLVYNKKLKILHYIWMQMSIININAKLI